MQIDAIYDQGRLEFQRPVTLKHQRLRVRVGIPDQEIIQDVTTDQASDANGERLLSEIRAILGPLSRARTPASCADDKAALSDALAEKYNL